MKEFDSYPGHQEEPGAKDDVCASTGCCGHRTEATVIGTATIASNAIPARDNSANGSRASMVSPKEISAQQWPTTPRTQRGNGAGDGCLLL